MKRVLVVGKGSYIGSSFAQYAKARFDIVAVSSRDEEWRKIDFNGFDSVVYVAGIAHRKQSKENRDLYFAVNRDLAVAVAEKAKAEGVGQFVYFSSIAVYGVKTGEISKDTIPTPHENDFYGLSKYQAENILVSMQTAQFKIVCIRPPMVYGFKCKGKFQGLLKIAKTAPFLPTIENKRSMIFIDNLSELLSIVIEQGVSGTLCPQNREYVCTLDMLAKVQKVYGKKYRRFPLLNLGIKILVPFSSAVRSAFEDLYYNEDVSRIPFIQEYQLIEYCESIKKSVVL